MQTMKPRHAAATLGAILLALTLGACSQPLLTIDGEHNATTVVTSSTVAGVQPGDTDTFRLTVITDGSEATIRAEDGSALVGTLANGTINIHETDEDATITSSLKWAADGTFSGDLTVASPTGEVTGSITGERTGEAATITAQWWTYSSWLIWRGGW